MKKLFSSNISHVIAIIIASALAYYLLLCENFLHTSIAEIIVYSHNLAITKHVLVLGLLPIYIALMVFGTAIFGIYLGLMLQHFLFKSEKPKQPPIRNQPI